MREHLYHQGYSKDWQRSLRIHSRFCFQNIHGSSHLDLFLEITITKCLPTIWKIPLKELFDYTKSQLYHRYFPGLCIGNWLCFTTCRNFKNTYFKQLFSIGFHWLPGFSNEINATSDTIAESCSTVKQNIKKIQNSFKFKINYASMNDYNYTNLRLSLKVVSLQICYRSSVTIVILINYTSA